MSDFKFDSAPDPAGGAYSAPPEREPTSKRREGRRKEGTGKGEE